MPPDSIEFENIMKSSETKNIHVYNKFADINDN